jgi:hypothetical protein
MWEFIVTIKRTIYKILLVALCANLSFTVIFAQGVLDDDNEIVYGETFTDEREESIGYEVSSYNKVLAVAEDFKEIGISRESIVLELDYDELVKEKEEKIAYYDDEDFIRIIYKDWITHDSYIERNQDGDEIIKYVSTMPKDLKVDLKYTEYLMYERFGLIKVSGANIRTGPGTEYSIIKKASRNQKYGITESEITQRNENEADTIWHKIYWNEGDVFKEGYIHSSLMEIRSFRFEEYYDKLLSVEKSLDINKNAYISNRFYQNGYAPRYHGKDHDNFGVFIYHAAPAYYEPSQYSEFRYIQDGAIVNVLEEVGSYYKVYSLSFDGEYYVPKRYVNFNGINELSMTILIDRKNQNEVVFEKIDDVWNLISYTYATTGDSGKYKYPTEIGVYKIIEKKRIMLYLDDETKELEGYAPYASRFSGGSYLHGVPVNYIFKKAYRTIKPAVLDEEGRVITPAVVRRVIIDKEDPGEREFSFSIGTYPLSHKCVRNYTSHAQFIYERSVIGKTSVIVYE